MSEPPTQTSDDPRLNRIRLLSCREVGHLLSVSRRTVQRMAARGELPPPIYLSEALPRWRLADIECCLGKLARREARSIQTLKAAQDMAGVEGVPPA